MSKIKTLINLIRNNDSKGLLSTILMKFGFLFNDELYLKLMYRIKMGKPLNLRNPQTFSEKLQWLKLYNRRPEYTMMVDKYAVKEYVGSIIGSQYVIPTLGVWDRPEDIEWEKLPNQFVLKTTHGGGNTGVVICRNKETIDKAVVVQKLNKSLKQNIYKNLREWPYKNVPKRIIAEKYISPVPEVNDLPDYKWYCFDGEPKYCQVIQNRSAQETIDFFDTKWNHQEFIGLTQGAVHADVLPECPADLEDQIRVAKELSQSMPYSRIDLFHTGEKTYFGEITLYPASGFGYFEPGQYNELIGTMVQLTGERVGGGNM